MKNRLSYGGVAAAVLAAMVSPAAFAQSFTASNTTAIINTTDHVSTITLDTGGVAIGGVQLVLDFTDANTSIPPAAAPHPEITVSDANLACSVPSAGRVSCGAFAPVANGTTIQIRFDIGGTAVPAPGSPLTFNTDPVTGSFFLDPMFAPIATTLNNGSVIISTAPPDVNLSYNPAANSTITFPSGVALTTQNASITVTGTGTVGSGTVTNCGITGPGAAQFGAPPGDVSVNGGATAPLALSCQLPNSGGAATATLTCTETDADTPAPGAARSWTLNCPQGTPVPGPGFGANPAPNPAPAAPLDCSGQAGTSVNRSIVITNNGNPGAGSDLTFTCTASGVASIVSGGATTAPGLAVGASQTLVVGCAVPADGVTSTGAVSCTSNAPGSPFAFNFSSTGSTLPPPVPRPAVIPASSFWSMAALITLLAGFGVALVGFRRK